MGPVTPAPGRTPAKTKEKQSVIVQHNGNYKLDVTATWIEPEMIRVQFRRTDLGIEYTDSEFYLLPEELAKLADHLNDVLAR